MIGKTGLLALSVALCLAAAADGYSTQYFLLHTCSQEMNPLFGAHPSPARIWGEGGLLIGLELGLVWTVSPKLRRFLVFALMGQTVLQAWLALHNWLY